MDTPIIDKFLQKTEGYEIIKLQQGDPRIHSGE